VRRFIGRDNLRKRLVPLEGKPGRTSYADAVVRMVVREAFFPEPVPAPRRP